MQREKHSENREEQERSGSPVVETQGSEIMSKARKYSKEELKLMAELDDLETERQNIRLRMAQTRDDLHKLAIKERKKAGLR